MRHVSMYPPDTLSTQAHSSSDREGEGASTVIILQITDTVDS